MMRKPIYGGEAIKRWLVYGGERRTGVPRAITNKKPVMISGLRLHAVMSVALPNYVLS